MRVSYFPGTQWDYIIIIVYVYIGNFTRLIQNFKMIVLYILYSTILVLTIVESKTALTALTTCVSSACPTTFSSVPTVSFNAAFPTVKHVPLLHLIYVRHALQDILSTLTAQPAWYATFLTAIVAIVNTFVVHAMLIIWWCLMAVLNVKLTIVWCAMVITSAWCATPDIVSTVMREPPMLISVLLVFPVDFMVS